MARNDCTTVIISNIHFESEFIIKVDIENLFAFSIFPVHYKIETINKLHSGEGVFKLRSCAATVSKLEIVLVAGTTDAQ